MLNFRCGRCGSINLVPGPRTEARCVRCGRKLDVSGRPQLVDDHSLRKALHSSMVPVLVELWALDPSMAEDSMASIVYALAHERAGRLIVLRVDSTADPALGQALRLKRVPELVLFIRGEEVARLADVAPRAEVERWIDRSLEAGLIGEPHARRGA